ncbi:MAG: hypothetical protein GF308_16650 [Candidatus Heimdallarchaeota archaeon]|nr:hypothetical protein [Candidatus Heimdallarchaeota archaeon]
MQNRKKLITVFLIICCIGNSLLVIGSVEPGTKLETRVIPSSFTGQSLGVQLKWNYTGGLGRGSSVIFDLDGNGDQEIIIGGRYGEVICLGATGLVEWSFDIGDHIYSTVTIVDLEGDGNFEVLVGSEYLSGEVKTFFCLNHYGYVKWTFEPFEGKIYATPTVIDIDKDGEFEILFGTTGGFLYCLEPNGEKNWHYDCGLSLFSSTAVVDFEGDGLTEIVTATNAGSILCLTHYGSLKWEYVTDNGFGSSPTIGDLEGDGELEVLLGGGDKIYGGPNNYLYCLDENGTLNWRYQAPNYIKSEPVLFDLNQDGQQEIIFGATDGAVYLLDSSGNESWSYQTDLDITSSATIADLDGDGSFEVIIGSINELFCFSYAGEKLWSYPLTSRVASSAGLGDLDGNNLLDIFCNCMTGKSYCLEVTGVSQSGLAPWYTFRGSMFHTGWADTDGDLIDDFTEGWYFQTDPANPDTDGDGLSDGEEYTYTTDPLDPDDPPEPTTSEPPPSTSPTPPTTTSPPPSTEPTPSTNDSLPFTGSLATPVGFSVVAGYSTILLVVVVIRRRKRRKD